MTLKELRINFECPDNLAIFGALSEIGSERYKTIENGF